MAVLLFFLALQMNILIFIMVPSFGFLTISSNINQSINNALSVLVLAQIDNMGSLILFNWLKSNYNKLTTSANFMQIKTSTALESIQVSIYLYFAFLFYQLLVLAKDVEYMKEIV